MKPNKKTHIAVRPALFLSLAAIAVPVMADDAPADLIVVTGSRVSDRLSELSNSTTVIDLAEIEARNDAGVLDLLRNAPGVMVSQPGGRGGVASLFVRGGEPNFTMILLDGVRMNDPNNTRGGSFDFSTLNIEDIERIEIVRGPQSAIYGSDALSGVINVITRDRADTLGLNAHAEVGEDDYSRYALGIAGPIGDSSSFSLRAASVDDGEPTEGSTYTSDSLTGKVTFGRREGAHLSLFGRYSDNAGTSFPEDSGGPEYAVLRDLDTKSSEDLSFGFMGSAPLGERWTFAYTASRYNHDDSYFSPGVAPGVRDGVPPNGADSELDRLMYSAYVVGDLSDRFRATFGADYHDERGSSDGFVEFFPGFSIPSGFEIERSVLGLFAELSYDVSEGGTLMASVRNDDPDAESSETTAKVGGIFDFNGGRTTVRGNWGQGFKLPSFYALASPLIGNPDLLSETSESWDLGVTQALGDGRTAVTFTVYRSVFTDLIDFDFDLFTNVNRNEVTAQGAELQFDHRVNEALAFSAEALYLDLDVKDSDTPLRQRPEWRGSVSMLWDVTNQLRWHATWFIQGETFDSSIPTGALWLDGYNRLDTTLSWRATDELQLLLSVDNLLDETYQEAIGFDSPGRRARLAVRYGF